MKQQGKEKSAGKIEIKLYQSKQDILFFYYNTQHPKSDISKSFSLGKLKLYTNKKVYSNDLSTQALNPSLNWSQQLFKRLINNLRSFVIYSQKDEYGQIFLQIGVYQKLGSKTICLCKIKMVQDFSSDIELDLWNQFQGYNNFKMKSFIQEQFENQVLKQNIQIKLNNLQNLQNQSQEQIELIKGKLSLILHEKQNKLTQLSGNKTKFNYEIQKEEKIQMDNMEWASSQQDRVLMGSLFESTQEYR